MGAVFCLHAQPYTTAVGARIGFGVGPSCKFFFSQRDVFEGILAWQWQEKGAGLTALYERHNYNILRSNSAAVFYGGGVHLAYYTSGYYKTREQILYAENVYNVGIDMILGLDFHESGTPLNWSLDVKPFFDLVNKGFRFWDGAVSVRWAF
ncbi:MAG: hypothetical protein IT233_03035 [Bacteroidia bacterium]|nr:hypothetical protein [Bacteroidia bacterium]